MFLYNVLGVQIATGSLYPAFWILPSPMVGVAAMALSSVSVIANALRLARRVSEYAIVADYIDLLHFIT